MEMLDALNDDCRRLVLSYVPVEDIVRAERVSRSWQQEVLKYLRGVRIIIEYNEYFYYEKTRGSYSRILQLNMDAVCFDQVTTKLGASIVASYCVNACTLLNLLNNCPNLEHVVVTGDLAETDLSFTEDVFNFKKLKQITFKYLMHIDDDFIRKFLGNALEEFTIFNNDRVTGHCLLSLPLQLKCLSLGGCFGLELQHLLSVLSRLPGLKKLELLKLAPEIVQNAHLLLDKVPNLEELAFNNYDAEIELKNDIAQSISRLRHLKRLNLRENFNVTDEWLVIIKRGCWQLQKLNFADCSALNARAVVMLCKAVASTLTALNVASIRSMTDEHVLDVIGSCPKLESLDVSYCPVSANFTAAAAQLCAARARPLRLRVAQRWCELNLPHPGIKRGTVDVYPGLFIDNGDSDDERQRYRSSY